MRFLFDTDVVSILQMRSGDAYIQTMARVSDCSMDDFAISIVTFHEQFLGAHTYIQMARTGASLERGYCMLTAIVSRFTQFRVILFDEETDDIFGDLRQQRVRIGTMDLRIAATALQYNLTLLTRNTNDFSKVPGLSFEDWTTP